MRKLRVLSVRSNKRRMSSGGEAVRSMTELAPSITLTPRASGDGTWYVEVVSPGMSCEDVGDFRSKASAEAWIRENRASYATDPACEDCLADLPATA